MSYSQFTVAKTACYLSGDRITGLQLQKLLYLMHMFHLGRTGRPLIAKEHFEAWKHEPVLPILYSRTCTFGTSPIPHDIFYKNDIIPKEDTEAYKSIRTVLIKMLNAKLEHLIPLVRNPRGAWGKHYKKGALNILIPDEDIREDYTYSKEIQMCLLSSNQCTYKP